MSSTASGYPLFGTRERYALSNAFANALLEIIRPLTRKVCQPRLLLSMDGLDT